MALAASVMGARMALAPPVPAKDAESTLRRYAGSAGIRVVSEEDSVAADFLNVFAFANNACENVCAAAPAAVCFGSRRDPLSETVEGEHASRRENDAGAGCSERTTEDLYEDAAREDALDLLDGSSMECVLDRAHPPCLLRPEAIDCDRLANCFFLHGLFEESFMEMLGKLAAQLPGDTSSHNMAATRRFFESEQLGEALLARLPRALGYSRVLPSMRFIEYDIGGYIRPHTDGVMVDSVTGARSTTSFLLYLQDTPSEGTTDFLDNVADGNVLHSVSPRRGSILLFPHDTPHEGTGVGCERKVLLRGDLF